MARKIKFGLNMPEKENIRTIEDLKEYFDLKSALEYYFNGKLTDWLNDRGYDDYVQQINKLDSSKDDFEEKLCKIFDVEFKNEALDSVTAEAAEALVDRKEEIRKYTDDADILDNADKVVFTQEELDKAVVNDEDQTIYLLGTNFKISSAYVNKTYIGLNNPSLKWAKKTDKMFDELKIKFKDVKLADNMKLAKKVNEKRYKRQANIEYRTSAAFEAILNGEQKKQSEKIFNRIVNGLCGLKFN